MINDPRFEGYSSYIMAAYTNFVESAGARVVPMILGESDERIQEKMSKLNGLLYPGGDGGYYDFGEKAFKIAKSYNDNGIYYPVWGTCLGYEYMASYVGGGWNKVIDKFESSNKSLPLTFTKDPRETQMFGWLGEEAFEFEDNNVTYNSHSHGINPKKFETI